MCLRTPKTEGTLKSFPEEEPTLPVLRRLSSRWAHASPTQHTTLGPWDRSSWGSAAGTGWPASSSLFHSSLGPTFFISEVRKFSRLSKVLTLQISEGSSDCNIKFYRTVSLWLVLSITTQLTSLKNVKLLIKDTISVFNYHSCFCPPPQSPLTFSHICNEWYPLK